MARSRNQRPPASLAALITFAVIALLIILAVRADAAPAGAPSGGAASAGATAAGAARIGAAPVAAGAARASVASLAAGMTRASVASMAAGTTRTGAAAAGATRASVAPVAAGTPLPALDDGDELSPRDTDNVLFAGGDEAPIVTDDDLPVGPVATAVLRAAPRLPDVIAAAHRAAGIDRASNPIASWRARSRWSALVPTVSVRAGNTASWRDVDDPTLVTVSRGAAFDVRASWHLDQLIYDPNEVRLESLDLALRRERRKVASITTRLYFAWVRAASRAADGADPRVELRAAELAAHLDAITAGWFSDQRTSQNR